MKFFFVCIGRWLVWLLVLLGKFQLDPLCRCVERSKWATD